MKRHLESDTSPARLRGRWMPDGLGHRPGPWATSTGGPEPSPAAAEPVASPGTLLAGGATELTTQPAAARAATTPAAGTADEPHAQSAKGRTRHVPGAPAGHCPRLVIADDDPVVRLTLGAALASEFELAGAAGDSEEAIELARACQPDAALVDVVMPKGGGLRAVRGILEVAPDTAIVMLSGYSADGVVLELIQAGAISYRRKGVAPSVLADALTESIKVHTADRRKSAWTILSWYCSGLNRGSRQRIGPS